jgi:hypothetical protein
MCEEEPLIGLYEPVSGSYVLEDEYKLIKDNQPNRARLAVKLSAELGARGLELEAATFKVIRTFKFCDTDNDPRDKIKLELQRVFIEGRFSVVLKPAVSISPCWFTKDDTNNVGNLFTPFDLSQLHSRPQPLVGIKGRFAHVRELEAYEGKKQYDVKIPRALLTEDFPGSFFRGPLLSSIPFSFISTDASITPAP